MHQFSYRQLSWWNGEMAPEFGSPEQLEPDPSDLTAFDLLWFGILFLSGHLGIR